MERPVGARITAARGEAPGGETDALTDGVRDVPRGVHRDAVSDRAGRGAIGLPDAVLEAVAGGVPAIGRAVALMQAVLKDEALKSGSGCPDPSWPSEKERR